MADTQSSGAKSPRSRSDTAGSDGARSPGAVSHGAVSDGARSDGARSDGARSRGTRPGRARSYLARGALAVRNALELVRLGRLSEPYAASFDVHEIGTIHRLRRYAGSRTGPAVLLVPPLMVTSEIYDISSELSAVSMLSRAGLDVWLCDFGAPEIETDGMRRTLDDHVRAIDAAIGSVVETTGRDVHLAGYSQGGMFCYQTAAYRRSHRIASIITFGSPVDIHRNLPRVADGVASHLIRVAQRILEQPLHRIDGLPGALTSTGFKVLSLRKEAAQRMEFLAKLHDRQALERRESRRLFLGGDGFVAWPGPALRTFIDDFVVHNRMVSGGFVIGGRTVSLADIRCPVLCFYGERDEFARPASVRAIDRAAPHAEVHEVELKAGHFGLVVGSRSQSITWPTVADWVHWREGDGPPPSRLAACLEDRADEDRPDEDSVEEPEDAAFDDVDVRFFVDAFTDVAGSVWRAVGRAADDVGDAFNDLRYQVPRFRELEQLGPRTQVSMAQRLARRAKQSPEETFFLWRNRAFSYADADRRVSAVVRGLVSLGVSRHDRVAIWMEPRPSLLTLVTALNRLGAVAAVIPAEVTKGQLDSYLATANPRALVVDPVHASAATDRASNRSGADSRALPVWCLGGGMDRTLPGGIVDMEQIDPEAVPIAGLELNAAVASELAMILLSAGRQGQGVRAARITNGRWALSAIGTAAAATLRPEDTVYAALPLHHASGMLVAVGSALAGGCRLALSEVTLNKVDGDADAFWAEVRRYGATVIYYAGDMCRALVNAPTARNESEHPVRLFAGSGMRPHVWEAMQKRFGVGVLEFYATTEAHGVLANASGEKIGSIGRPMPGSQELAIVEADFDTREVRRHADGYARLVNANQPGLLLVRLADGEVPTEERVLRSVLVEGDSWYATSDIVRRDTAGDYWLLGRLPKVVVRGQPVFSRQVEEALDALDAVAFCTVVRHGNELVAYVVPRQDRTLRTDALESLSFAPDEIRVIEALPLTSGFRASTSALDAAYVGVRFRRDESGTQWHSIAGHE